MTQYCTLLNPVVCYKIVGHRTTPRTQHQETRTKLFAYKLTRTRIGAGNVGAKVILIICSRLYV